MPALTWVEAPKFIDKLHGQAMANDGLLLLTDDGGQQWRTVRAPDDTASPGKLLFSDPQNGWLFRAEPVFAGGTRAFATTDGGTTWHALPNIPLNSLEGVWALGPTRLVLTGFLPLHSLGPRNGSLLSEDGGRTWSELSLQVDELASSGLMSGLMTGLTSGLQSSEVQLRLSIDGGKTARTILEPTVQGWPQTRDFSNPKRLQLIVSAASGSEHRSSVDGGVTWTSTPVVFPPAVTASMSDARLEGDFGWANGHSVDANSVLLRSVDGGRHWSLAPLPAGLTGRNDVQTIRFHGESLLSLQGYHGEAWVSRDAAKSWQPVQLSDPSELLELESAGGGVLRASTGESKSITVTPCSLSPLHCTHTETTIHRRYVSTDGGASWRLMPGGRPVTP